MIPATFNSWKWIMAAVACLLAAVPVQAQIISRQPSTSVGEPVQVVARGVAVVIRGVSTEVTPEITRVVEDQLALAGDSRVSAPLADDLAYFVRRQYFQLGFSEAQVDWRLAAGAIDLAVVEGPRLVIGAINFLGVDPEMVDDLTSFLTRVTREREGLLTRRLPFVEADMRAGVDLVARHLRAQGYLDAATADPVFLPSPTPDSIDVTIEITLGVRSVFGEIRVAGDVGAVGEDTLKRARELTGQPFNEVTLETTRMDIRGGLQERGHFAAEVEAVAGTRVSSAPELIAVPATFLVAAGKRYAVRSVRVDEALGRGSTRVARSVFAAATSQTFSPHAIDLLHRRALDTGIFSRLDVEPVVVDDGVLDLWVKGEEAKPKMLGFYGGYESLYGPILGMEARHANFLDSGNSVAVRGEFRGTGGVGGVQWTDPAILGSRWSLAAGVSWETFTFKDYDRQTAAVKMALTRRLTRRITAEIFGELSTNDAASDVLSQPELGPEDYRTASGGVRLTIDYRDHPLLAREGWMIGLTVEAGLIDGDEQESFVRTDAVVAWHYPLSARWRFSLGARSHLLLTPAEASAIPIDLRLFNGGATSVRSFAEREMGPMSAKGDTPLGGLASGVASAEFAWQAIRNLEVAAFADAGSIGDESSSFFEIDELRYALGLGVRYRLPVGPLRIDYGVNPDRRDGESFGALHITFGFAF